MRHMERKRPGWQLLEPEFVVLLHQLMETAAVAMTEMQS
jgi:hypothetical protein